MFFPGDRIELVMRNDPSLGRPGLQGTVTSCVEVTVGPPGELKKSYWQVDVRWDDGKADRLSIPPDQARLVTSLTAPPPA